MIERGYAVPIVKKYLSELKFADSKTALQQSNKSARKKTTTFCYTIPPGFTQTVENTMGKQHLIKNQHDLREIFKEPPLISYHQGKSIKDLLVRAKQITSLTTEYRSCVLRLLSPSFKPGNLRCVIFPFPPSLVMMQVKEK